MKKNGSKFFFFVLTTLCVALCIVVSHFFAGLISTSTFSFANISASVSEYSLYAVSGKSFSIKTQATEFANDLKTKNSGSYIYCENGKYYVICSIYEHENDAKSVVENICETLPEAEIVEIKLSGINFVNLTNENFKKSIVDVFAGFKQTYLDLYDISVSLDTSVYSQTKAMLECSKIEDYLADLLNAFPEGSTATEGAYLVLIKNKIKKINQRIDDLINFNDSTSYTFRSKIKNTYIEIVFDLQDLIESLNEK
ncbi:MAG: hypothetical protein J5779_00725 [Clostridia bacterium]|nr:hypothetical protein [Clostridia bacterium]